MSKSRSRRFADFIATLQTTSSGVDVTGTVNANELTLGDDEKAKFGADNDLQIYHDGAGAPAYYNYIESSRPLAIKATSSVAIQIQDSSGNKYANCALGAVNLFHNGDAKFATQSTGIAVTGQVTAEAYTETVYNTGTALDPANGGIQYKTLSANTTFTDSLSNGESMTLRLEGGATYTVTYPTMTWIGSGGNVAPTLNGTKDTLVFWKENSTLYGAYVGYGA